MLKCFIDFLWLHFAQMYKALHKLWHLCHFTLLRNASISMNAETVGEHTMKFEDKNLREGIVHMLKGNSSNSVWVSVNVNSFTKVKLKPTNVMRKKVEVLYVLNYFSNPFTAQTFICVITYTIFCYVVLFCSAGSLTLCYQSSSGVPKDLNPKWRPGWK